MINITREQIEAAIGTITMCQIAAMAKDNEKDLLMLGVIRQILEDKLEPKPAYDDGGDIINKDGKWEAVPFYRCPCCGFAFGKELAEEENCPKCGQVIDRGNEDGTDDN